MKKRLPIFLLISVIFCSCIRSQITISYTYKGVIYDFEDYNFYAFKKQQQIYLVATKKADSIHYKFQFNDEVNLKLDTVNRKIVCKGSRHFYERNKYIDSNIYYMWSYSDKPFDENTGIDDTDSKTYFSWNKDTVRVPLYSDREHPIVVPLK